MLVNLDVLSEGPSVTEKGIGERMLEYWWERGIRTKQVRLAVAVKRRYMRQVVYWENRPLWKYNRCAVVRGIWNGMVVPGRTFANAEARARLKRGKWG